jgi:hypothetical protein
MSDHPYPSIFGLEDDDGKPIDPFKFLKWWLLVMFMLFLVGMFL